VDLRSFLGWEVIKNDGVCIISRNLSIYYYINKRQLVCVCVVVYRLKNYMSDFDEHFKNIVLTDTKKV